MRRQTKILARSAWLALQITGLSATFNLLFKRSWKLGYRNGLMGGGKIISEMVWGHKHQDPQDSIHLFISCKHIGNLLCAQILGMRCWRQDVVSREPVVVSVCTHVCTHPPSGSKYPPMLVSALSSPCRATPCRTLSLQPLSQHGNPSSSGFQ